MKWKVPVLEHSTKGMFFDQLLENQGEELFVDLIKVRLLMIRLYYLKKKNMVM
jgi:hypothetical protein